MIEDIAMAQKRGADIVVVLLHWGNEYETKHLASQETTAHHLIDAGATIVIGHHPHVVQEIEKYKGGVIAYSLGNFIFDQNMTTDTRRGLLLKVALEGKDISKVDEIPIQFSDNYQPFLNQAATTTLQI
jgi:poly-gamma-glutamate synthesis protein (capsule biosynthesis protein)